MRSVFLFLVVSLFHIYAEASSESGAPALLEQSPLRCNSLKGYSRFLLSPQYAIADFACREEVETMLMTELAKIGKVICLPTNDVTGLGDAEGILVFDVQELRMINGKRLPNILGCFAFYTALFGGTEERRKVEMWKAQGIGKEPSQAKDYLSVLLPLLHQFTSDYQSENPEQVPIFYLYSDRKST